MGSKKCPLNGFTVCSEECLFWSVWYEDCLVRAGLSRIVAEAEPEPEPEPQPEPVRHTLAELDAWVQGTGAEHFEGMSSTQAFVEYRDAMGEGELQSRRMVTSRICKLLGMGLDRVNSNIVRYRKVVA